MNIAKWTYKNGKRIAHKLGLYESRKRRYFEHFKDLANGKEKVVVDLACGRGTFGKLFDNKKNFVIFLDIDEERLERITGLTDNTMKLRANAHKPPLPTNSVDVVLAMSALEHFSNFKKVMKEVKRILTPAGHFIVQLPNLLYFLEPHTKFPLLFMLPKRLKRVVTRAISYGYINFDCTINKVMQTAENLGFLLKKKVSVFHNFKSYPWPPAWILIYLNQPD